MPWTELLLSISIRQPAADRFRFEYQRHDGHLPNMAWFEAATAFKRLFSVLLSLDAGPEVLGMRSEARARVEP